MVNTNVKREIGITKLLLFARGQIENIQYLKKKLQGKTLTQLQEEHGQMLHHFPVKR